MKLSKAINLDLFCRITLTIQLQFAFTTVINGNGLYPAHYLWPGMSYQSYHPSPITLPRHFQLYQISPLRQRQPYSSFTTYSGDLRTSRTWSNFHSGQNNFHSYPGPKYASSQKKIQSPAVTPRSQVTVPQKKSQHNSAYEVDPVNTLNHDTDYQEDDEEAFQDDDGAPYLIEGDIALPEDLDPRSRLAIDFMRHPAKRWPNNTVPYRMSKNYTTSEELMILSAMRTISFVSCIKFVEWDGVRKDYIHFHPHKTRLGCWSYIGRQKNRQQLSLQRPTEKDCKCFCSPGLAMHEIMHALGFYHEHARSDRDKYIKIIRKNVRKGLHQNFDFQNDDKSTRNFNYDYDSLMHYGPYSFRKNKRKRKATIVPLKPGVSIGQREMLSKTDCMKLNSQYRCFQEDKPEQVSKIQIICGMVGV